VKWVCVCLSAGPVVWGIRFVEAASRLEWLRKAKVLLSHEVETCHYPSPETEQGHRSRSLLIFPCSAEPAE
jgi:hypothetical protein